MMKYLFPSLGLLLIGLSQSSQGVSLQFEQHNNVGRVDIAQVKKVQYDPYVWPSPPPWQQKAQMARYLAHYADWCVVSSYSEDLGGVPFGELQSFADGTLDNSTGTPYFYFAAVSTMLKNIKFNNSVSMTVSLAQSGYCNKQHMDPELPTCSRLTLTGKMLAVESLWQPQPSPTCLPDTLICHHGDQGGIFTNWTSLQYFY